jgi:hypothetical protein
LREYNEIDPVILSGESFVGICMYVWDRDKDRCWIYAMYDLVAEDQEISIKAVADAIVKAMAFQGEYKVISPLHPPQTTFVFATYSSSNFFLHSVRYNALRWPIP